MTIAAGAGNVAAAPIAVPIKGPVQGAATKTASIPLRNAEESEACPVDL
jgi:hypothetical protein